MRRGALLAPLAMVAALASAGGAAAPAAGDADPVLVYDGEYGGYVAVLGGIQRPELTADELGRVAATREEARRRLRRNLRRSRSAEPGPDHMIPRGPQRERRGTWARWKERRWERRTGVRSEITVYAPGGRPIEGALVFRFHDPSFHAWNLARDGSRLVDGYRMRPYPFPLEHAETVLETYLDRWLDAGPIAVTAGRGDFDLESNPWVRWHRSESPPPLEFVGLTDALGSLTTVSGVFNLLDERRFPDATAPSALRIGFLVVAEGFEHGRSVFRFEGGGIRDPREIVLEPATGRSLLASTEYRAALQAAEALGRRSDLDVAERDRRIDDLLTELVKPAARVAEPERAAALTRARARVLRAAAAHSPLPFRESLLRRALALEPDSAHVLHQLAVTLAASRGVYAYEPAGRTPDPEGGLAEAEALLRRAVAASPSFAPAYALLERLLAERGAPLSERAATLAGLVAAAPYDRWARARAAALALREGFPGQAWSHLPFTWAAGTRLGVDAALALALADHYRSLGLPEKAGYYAFASSGRVPEDSERAYPRPEDATEGGR